MRAASTYMSEAQELEIEYPPVTEELLSEIVRRILDIGSPLKIILFGSRAKGTAKSDSDIDILVIEETNRNCRELQMEYREAIDSLFPEKDILVSAIGEVEQWRNVHNHVLTEAARDGKVLFEDPVRLSKLYTVDPDSPPGAPRHLVCESGEPKTACDLARQWFEKAECDLADARLIVSHRNQYVGACFHIQQSIEKYFKAFILLHGFSAEKTHDLDSLRWRCRQIENMPELSRFNLKDISAYAVEPRYSDPWPSKEAAEKALMIAEQIREFILANVPREAHPLLQLGNEGLE